MRTGRKPRPPRPAGPRRDRCRARRCQEAFKSRHAAARAPAPRATDAAVSPLRRRGPVPAINFRNSFQGFATGEPDSPVANAHRRIEGRTDVGTPAHQVAHPPRDVAGPPRAIARRAAGVGRGARCGPPARPGPYRDPGTGADRSVARPHETGDVRQVRGLPWRHRDGAAARDAGRHALRGLHALISEPMASRAVAPRSPDWETTARAKSMSRVASRALALS